MIHLTAQNLTSREMVQNVFSPLIAVVCSPSAEEMCYKNNLSFVEMLQPFSKLTSDGMIEMILMSIQPQYRSLRILFLSLYSRRNWCIDVGERCTLEYL